MTGVKSRYSCILILNLLGLILISTSSVHGQKRSKKGQKIDTVYAKMGQYVIMPDTDFLAVKDTFFINGRRKKVKVKDNPYARTEAFYDSLKVKSYQNKVSKELYGLLFRNQATTVSDSVNVINSIQVFLPFEDDIIKNIILKKVDILEGSVYDTTLVAVSGMGRALNKVHMTTKDRMIFENLLFKVGDRVNPYQLADNERILRKITFIDDALIEIVPDLNDKGVVDVIVITQDLMALGIDGSLSSLTDWRLAIYNRNFLGKGDEIYFQYRTDDEETPTSGGLVRFRTQNIRGTFINGQIKYQNDFIEESFTVDLSRDFVTPEIKYAGGIGFGDIKSYVDGRTAFDTIPRREKQLEFRKTFYDIWLGRSWRLNKNNERQNFVLSGRLLRENFSERPPTNEDQNLAFQDKYLLIGSIAYTQREFLKSNYIFTFGRTEDIPEGYLFKISGGYEKGEFKSRPYLSTEIGMGEYWDHFGYFGARVGIGGFIDKEKIEQGNINFSGLYFTPLTKLGRTKVRQFLTFNYVKGFQRDSTDLVNLRGFTRGTNGGKFRGDERLALNYEADFFTPINFYGFKLIAFPFVDWGWLAFNEKLIQDDNFYYGFGFGIRFRNESFILRTISISLSFYPQLVEGSTNLNVNFTATDPRLFRGFATVKPDLISYR